MSENKIYSSIAELVGNTPLVELGNYEKQHDLHARVLAKLEYFNPSGSVKDRAALSMILDAEKKGKIKRSSISQAGIRELRWRLMPMHLVINLRLSCSPAFPQNGRRY